MIQLRSVTINNFRGILESHIDGLTDVSVFVGRNNSGKTTVLEAIHRGLTSGGNDLIGRSIPGYWSKCRGNGDNAYLHFRGDSELKNSIQVDLKDGESVFSCSSDPFNNSWASPDPTKSSKTFMESASVVRPADAFDVDIERKFWPDLLTNRRDKQLAQALNEIFSLDAESFQLLPNGQLMVLFPNHSLPLDVQGDGTRAAMRTLMWLSMAAGSLCMLEEPECHQHPGSLERYARAVCRLAKAQQVQLIISTHSAECARAFLKGARDAESQAALFHLSLTDGIQDVRRLDPEAVESLNETGIDVRFLDLYA